MSCWRCSTSPANSGQGPRLWPAPWTDYLGHLVNSCWEQRRPAAACCDRWRFETVSDKAWATVVMLSRSRSMQARPRYVWFNQFSNGLFFSTAHLPLATKGGVVPAGGSAPAISARGAGSDLGFTRGGFRPCQDGRLSSCAAGAYLLHSLYGACELSGAAFSLTELMPLTALCLLGAAAATTWVASIHRYSNSSLTLW